MKRTIFLAALGLLGAFLAFGQNLKLTIGTGDNTFTFANKPVIVFPEAMAAAEMDKILGSKDSALVETFKSKYALDAKDGRYHLIAGSLSKDPKSYMLLNSPVTDDLALKYLRFTDKLGRLPVSDFRYDSVIVAQGLRSVTITKIDAQNLVPLVNLGQ